MNGEAECLWRQAGEFETVRRQTGGSAKVGTEG